MATLLPKTDELVFTLTPRETEEDTNPLWIRTVLELRRGSQLLNAESFTLTLADYEELLRGMRQAAEDGRRFEMTGTDQNFHISIAPAGGRGDVSLGYWLGEPYVLMHGYRFVVPSPRMREFVSALEGELEQAVRAVRHGST
jgi:hypothetical protein